MEQYTLYLETNDFVGYEKITLIISLRVYYDIPSLFYSTLNQGVGI